MSNINRPSLVLFFSFYFFVFPIFTLSLPYLDFSTSPSVTNLKKKWSFLKSWKTKLYFKIGENDKKTNERECELTTRKGNKKREVEEKQRGIKQPRVVESGQ